MSQIGKEFLYAIRSLSKSFSFAILSIGILALGIGANTAIFSVFYGVLLKSLPYPDPERIVLVWGTNQRAGTNHDPVSATDLADYRAQNKSFEEITTYTSWRPILSGANETERISALQVGDGYFRIMKSKILLGRTFLTEEQNEGKDFVVVLSYGLWQRQFAKDPAIVGKEIRLNARRYIVVGVLTPDSHSLPKGLVDDRAELYRPVAEPYNNKERSSRHLLAIGRLKSAVLLQIAQAEMTAIAKRLEQMYPNDDKARGIRLVSFPEENTGKLRRALYLLGGAAALVLLIACANIANLLLARSSEREHEMAIKVSLGAPKSALIRQVLIECLLISIVGSVIGILFAFTAVEIISTVGVKVIPQIQNVHLNVSVLIFNVVISLLSCCVLGIAPVHHTNSLNLHDALKEGGRGTGTGVEKHRLRNMLVISEMALAIILLAGAGLLMRSVIELYNVNPGFNPHGIITMNVGLPGAKYPEDHQRIAFFKSATARINVLPGIKSAGFTTVLPLSSNFDGRGISVEGQPRDPSDELEADMYVVTPGYLKAMMIPLRDGRMLTDQDTEKSSMVVLVSEAMGKQVWPGQNPIGHRIRLFTVVDETTPWRTVVGIVGDVKQYGLNTTSPWQFYVPDTQFGSYSMTLVARTNGDPINYASTIRNEILKIDPEQPAFDIAAMEDVLGDSIAVHRFSMILLAVFAVLALMLASAGIYAVVSYLTTRRTHEIGIRLALGAQQHNVLTMVLRQGLFLSFTGAATGLIAAAILSRLTSTLLFNVKPYDPLTYIAIAVLLIAVAAVACCIPALRATKVDPMIALRYE
ncbi:ABC transporter permease [bacterium]|nr:ABC transporter permease [bacterium]